MKKIHCTAKLINKLNLEIDNIVEEPISLGLGDWYSNIFLVNRRQNIVFTNTKTLLSFIVPNLLKKDLKSYETLFINGLTSVLTSLEFEENVITQILKTYDDIRIVKTESKSNIGYMNDAVQNYKHSLSVKGSNFNINDFNKTLNQLPQKALDWKFAVDVLKENIIKIINNKA